MSALVQSYDYMVICFAFTDRVIDDMNPDNHFSKGQLENLLKSEVGAHCMIICIKSDAHIQTG